MAKIRPGLKKDEYIKRYVESAVISAVRQKRYLQEYQNLPEKIATIRALNQAMGMIASGGYKNAKELLTEIKNMSEALMREIETECLHCPFMSSLNLFRKDEVRKKEAGGELYVLSLTLDYPKSLAIYHNAGGLIGSLENIIIGVHKSLLKKTCILHLFFWHFLRDLKASLFFACCGRYRQSISTLRSALELIFTGIYFQDLKEKLKKKEFDKEWKKWIMGKGKGYFGKGKEIFNLSKDQKDKIGRLYSELSKRVHGIINDEFEVVTVKSKPPARPSSAFFDVEFLKEWFDYFIQLVEIFSWVFLKVSSKYSLRKTKRSEKGLILFKNLLQELKNKKKRTKFLKFVECPKLTSKI